MYAELTQKVCSRCKTSKDVELFYKIAGGAKPRPECKSCTNAYHKRYRATPAGAAATTRARVRYNSSPDNVLKDAQTKAEWARFKKYGLVKSQFNKMSEQQNHRCKICARQTKLVVDHCHKTGAVRGLLCNLCNRGLGLFLDCEDALIAAATYLVKCKK